MAGTATETGKVPTVAEQGSAASGPVTDDTTLSELARWAAGEVEDAISCGITVSASSENPRVGASSDELARRMDAIQYVLEDGPCLSCMRQREEVRIPDLRRERRWLEFAVRGQREGVGSSLSVPMIVGDEVVGAVNLYSPVHDGLDDGSLERARQVAEQAGKVISEDAAPAPS